MALQKQMLVFSRPSGQCVVTQNSFLGCSGVPGEVSWLYDCPGQLLTFAELSTELKCGNWVSMS